MYLVVSLYLITLYSFQILLVFILKPKVLLALSSSTFIKSIVNSSPPSPMISLNDPFCPWFADSPPTAAVFLQPARSPPSQSLLSLQPPSPMSSHLTSPPCLLPINFGADGRALLSLCESDWQGPVINLSRRPVVCCSALSLRLSIILSFDSPLPRSPPHPLLFFSVDWRFFLSFYVCFTYCLSSVNCYQNLLPLNAQTNQCTATWRTANRNLEEH